MLAQDHKHNKIRESLKPHRRVEERQGKFYAVPMDGSDGKSAGSGILGSLKHRFKAYPTLYRVLVVAFSPVFVRPSSWRRLRELLAGFHEEDTVVFNLGSGPKDLLNRRDFINVDMFALEAVDLIADAHDLPIRDGAADLITSMTLLEHVQQPEVLVAEISRILKPGGHVICCIPFVAPFHAAPYDYTRWTERGVQQLFREFDNVEVEVWGGPTSGLLWVLQDWLALVFSLGNPRVRDSLAVALMLTTFPFKFLDLAVAGLRGAERLASTFLITAVKRGQRSPIE